MDIVTTPPTNWAVFLETYGGWGLSLLLIVGLSYLFWYYNKKLGEAKDLMLRREDEIRARERAILEASELKAQQQLKEVMDMLEGQHRNYHEALTEMTLAVKDANVLHKECTGEMAMTKDVLKDVRDRIVRCPSARS